MVNAPTQNSAKKPPLRERIGDAARLFWQNYWHIATAAVAPLLIVYLIYLGTGVLILIHESINVISVTENRRHSS